MPDTHKYMSWFWQQLRAEVFTIRCVSAVNERCTVSTSYTIAQFMNAEKFLRHRNANDDHIYGRPESTKYILVDDVDEQGLRWLRDDGLTPVLIVMTSKGNFQAWIKVSNEELSIPLAAASAKLLAVRYDGDEGSADAQHLGRIPGFTNRKEKCRDEHGRYFWTRATIPGYGIAPAAASLLADAETMMKRLPCALSVSTCGGVLSPITCMEWRSDMTPEEAVMIHREAANTLAADFQWTDGQRNDRSEVDYHVASRLLRGGLREHDVVAIINYASAKAREKGVVHGLRYAMTTVRKAAAQIEGEDKKAGI